MNVGRVLGAEVRLDPLLVVTAMAALALGYLPEVVMFAAVLALHELAHLAAAVSQEMAPTRIVLHPFGGVAQVPNIEVQDGRAMLPVALAGPAMNLLLAGGGMLAMRHAAWLAPGPRLGLWVDTNLGMALVNLVPVLPLDGGQVVRAHLAGRLGMHRSGHLLATCGRVVGGGLAAVGVASLVFGWRLVDVGVFGVVLALAAGREVARLPYARAVALETKRTALRAGAVLTERTLVAGPDVALGTVWRAMAPRAVHRIRVLDDGGAEMATVDEARLYEALVRLGPGGRLGDAIGPHRDAR